MSTRRKFIQVLSAAGAALFIRAPLSASAEEEGVEVKELPMMPIRDVVIFPYMMTPFVVGRESSVHALEEALAADKKIFLATQHDASIDKPKPNEIYQVGTVVNIVQSLKLPDGNIKVLVEGIERGKILQVTETEGFMQASVRLARYATETNPQIEAGMQRVTGLFEQYVKLCRSLNYETMIAAVRMEDPAKLTDTIAANLQLSIEGKQELLEIFDPAKRLRRIGSVLNIEIKKLKMDEPRRDRENADDEVRDFTPGVDPDVIQKASNALPLLSKRELEAIRGLSEGLTNREITERLGISTHTVKNYLFRVYDKLGVSNRVELLKLLILCSFFGVYPGYVDLSRERVFRRR